MNERILIVGGIYAVMHTFLPSLPLLGGECIGTNYYIYPGGITASAAVAIARYGSGCILCSKVGGDYEGEKLKAFLQGEGIDTRFVRSEPKSKTGMIISMNEQSGGRRTVRFPMCCDSLAYDDIENAFTCYPDALYIQSQLSDELVLCAMKHASRQDIPIFFQPLKSKPTISPSLLPSLEALILDGDEVYNYCGVEVDLYEKCLPACMALSKFYDAKYIILRMPERGSFIYDGKYHEIIGTFPVDSVDTSGCREVFGSVMCADYMKTKNIRQAVCIANVAYAISGTRRGDVQSVPTLRAISDYIESNSIKLN